MSTIMILCYCVDTNHYFKFSMKENLALLGTVLDSFAPPFGCVQTLGVKRKINVTVPAMKVIKTE